MIITHETTIEEYEAWLATNPPISQLRKAVNATFRMVYASLRRIKKIFKRVKVRSCLTPKVSYTVHPLSYNKNAIGTPEMAANFSIWLMEIKRERERVSMQVHLDKIITSLEADGFTNPYMIY